MLLLHTENSIFRQVKQSLKDMQSTDHDPDLHDASVHMKAPSVLFNFPYPKIWICILRYEFTNFGVVLGRRV